MRKVGQDKKHAFYRLSPDETMAELKTTRAGLTVADAARRLEEQGSNVLAIEKRESWPVTYLRQFKDLMIVLLLSSGALSLYLGDIRTSFVLLLLVLFNTTIGFIQEFKAEQTLQALEKLVIARAKVLRGGSEIEIDSTELVVGDIVRIEAGDSVPADLRVITEDELATNDFALTGESNPTRKFKHALRSDQPLSGRQNLVFMGTTVANGEAFAVVVGTGMNTEIGRIAGLSQAAPELMSPLQREMNNIATKVTQGTVALCAVLLPIAIYSGLNYKDAFLFAIGIASSIIPQGLPAEINTALAGAANKLARARALVKKLSAVETLGATNVILTDKTGTLTKNQMTVEQLLIGKTEYLVSGTGYAANGAILDTRGRSLTGAQLKNLSLFFQTGALASNALVNPPDTEHSEWHVIGDPTEGALITLARKAGLEPTELFDQFPEHKEYAFDSDRKRMSSVREIDGQLYLFVKGAPESVLEKSTDLWDHGHISGLTKKDREFLLDYNDKHAALAQRNLAFAYRVLPKGFNARKEHLEAAEQELTFLGVVSMVDPLRDEVPKAMQAARRAHMRVSIITGDFATTAKAIATRAKLADSADDLVVVAGGDLPSLSDAQILQFVRAGGTIFSRVAPEDKLRIVTLAEQAGLVVAVTGDGINDAPALKRANIGVAMGMAGTDVAKQSADIILLDDSFHTLVGAVQDGRTIFRNIQKGTLSCFTSNMAELFTNLMSLGAMVLFSVPLAISVMQILAIDLIAELFPIAALGRDKPEGELMHEKPRDLKDHILNKRSIVELVWIGLLIGTLAFGNYLFYFWRRGLSAEHVDTGTLLHMGATTLTYLTIVLIQLTNILQRRSQHGLFTRYQFHNRSLWGAMLLSLTCVLLIIYSPINKYFHAAPLGFTDWLFALLAVAIFVAIREFHIRTRKHTRRALLEMHHPAFLLRHLQKR